MSRRRPLLSAIVAATLVGIVLAVRATLPARPGVTKANFDRIEKGMPLAEVKLILGDDVWLICDARLGSSGVWSHEDGSRVNIIFDTNVATHMSWCESTETIADKLRRWLHLPK